MSPCLFIVKIGEGFHWDIIPKARKYSRFYVISLWEWVLLFAETHFVFNIAHARKEARYRIGVANTLPVWRPRNRGCISGNGKRFLSSSRRPDRVLCLPNLLYSVNWRPLPQGKKAGAWEHLTHILFRGYGLMDRYEWPPGLRRRSVATRLLGIGVGIPPEAWMSVSFECCALSGRGLCDGPIAHPDEVLPRVVCLIECDL